MAKGGYRPGGGRPRKTAKLTPELAESAPPLLDAPVVDAVAIAALAEGQTPLEYMIAVMRDPRADLARRDRMAIAAAPFMHARLGEKTNGKREEIAEVAQQSATGRYEPPAPPPRLVVDNRA